MNLGVVHVVGGLAAEHGGPSYSVPRLCRALSAGGSVSVSLYSVAAREEVTSACSERGYADRRFAHDHARTPVLNGLRLSSGLGRALRKAGQVEVIHNHGLWLAPNIEAGRAAAWRGIPLVMAPRGMLSSAALSFSARKKRLVWRLAQGRVVRSAACIHATSQAEYEEVRAFGLRNPVAIVPNGIDIPATTDSGEPPTVQRTLLSLGRVHPKKNLNVLLRAWARLEPVRPDWRLRIVGPAEDGHDEELRAQARVLGLSRATIEGPIFGESKRVAYADAELFALPTSNENFGLTVAEALAAGTPVIATKGAPWSGLAREGCGWWIDQGEGPLAAALEHATSTPRETLQAMGARGRAWMERDFSWDGIAAEMAAVYGWLARGGDAPACVRFD